MGYVKKGSAKSGAAGLFTGAALLAVFYLLPTAPLSASILGLGTMSPTPSPFYAWASNWNSQLLWGWGIAAISATLLSIMGSRFASSKKMMPSGMVALISLVMTGGYIHGIVRTHWSREVCLVPQGVDDINLHAFCFAKCFIVMVDVPPRIDTFVPYVRNNWQSKKIIPHTIYR